MPTTLRRDVLELDQSPLLPRLDAAYVRALNRLLDRRRSVPMLDLRVDAMRLRWSPFVPRAPGAAYDAFRFRLGAHGGWLVLDAGGQATLLGEPRADLLPRELRYVLIADAVQAAVERIERHYRMRFEWAPDEEEDARPTLVSPPSGAAFTLEGVDTDLRVSGQLHFDQPGAFDLHVPPVATDGVAPAAPGLDRLRFALNFCLGRTRISLREVREIRPGDIVSLETTAPKGQAVRVVAQVGGARGLSLVARAEGQRITLQPMKGTAMNRDPQPDALGANGDDDSFDDNAAPTLDRLDGMEVTLRFEVGELSASLGELKALRAGHVFELPQALNRSTVRILAHGNVLGKGQLVAVGDRLGVRVAEFAATDL